MIQLALDHQGPCKDIAGGLTLSHFQKVLEHAQENISSQAGALEVIYITVVLWLYKLKVALFPTVCQCDN